MKNSKNKILAAIIIMFMISFLFIILNYKTYADGLPYSSNPILDTKLKKIGYFKYEIHPNQTIKLPFVVSNNSGHDIKISNMINDAYSSSNGNISYDKRKAPGLLIPEQKRLSSMVVGNKRIVLKLKPHTSKKLHFTIKTPKKLWNGNLLGGINSTSDSYIDNGNVRNKINYSTTILLNHKAKQPNLDKINLIKVESLKNNLNILFHNAQKYLIHNYKIDIKLKKNGKLIASKKNPNYGLVPNSIGNYNLSLFNVKSGTYQLIIKLTDNHNHSIYIKRNVLIKNSYQALSTYKRSHHDNGLTFLIVIMVLFSVMIIVFGIYILFKI